jgi:hypothetical protein
MEQTREAESAQAIDRLRLVHRQTPATVFVLSNLPLDLTVDQVTTWDALMPSRSERAFVRNDGVLPLSANEKSRCFPDLWETPKTAEREQENTPKLHIDLLYGKWGYFFPTAISATYRRDCQRGKASPVLLDGKHRGQEREAVEASQIGAVSSFAITALLNADLRPVVTFEQGEAPKADPGDMFPAVPTDRPALEVPSGFRINRPEKPPERQEPPPAPTPPPEPEIAATPSRSAPAMPSPKPRPFALGQPRDPAPPDPDRARRQAKALREQAVAALFAARRTGNSRPELRDVAIAHGFAAAERHWRRADSIERNAGLYRRSERPPPMPDWHAIIAGQGAPSRSPPSQSRRN